MFKDLENNFSDLSKTMKKSVIRGIKRLAQAINNYGSI